MRPHVIPAKAGIYRGFRVLLWIPAFAGMTACYSADSSGTSTEKKTLIVAIGDSTTAGTPFFRSPLEAPPDGEGNPEGQYAYWMMRQRPHWQVLNFGINGETSSQIHARFEAAIKA